MRLIERLRFELDYTSSEKRAIYDMFSFLLGTDSTKLEHRVLFRTPAYLFYKYYQREITGKYDSDIDVKRLPQGVNAFNRGIEIFWHVLKRGDREKRVSDDTRLHTRYYPDQQLLVISCVDQNLQNIDEQSPFGVTFRRAVILKVDSKGKIHDAVKSARYISNIDEFKAASSELGLDNTIPTDPGYYELRQVTTFESGNDELRDVYAEMLLVSDGLQKLNNMTAQNLSERRPYVTQSNIHHMTLGFISEILSYTISSEQANAWAKTYASLLARINVNDYFMTNPEEQRRLIADNDDNASLLLYVQLPWVQAIRRLCELLLPYATDNDREILSNTAAQLRQIAELTVVEV